MRCDSLFLRGVGVGGLQNTSYRGEMALECGLYHMHASNLAYIFVSIKASPVKKVCI